MKLRNILLIGVTLMLFGISPELQAGVLPLDRDPYSSSLEAWNEMLSQRVIRLVDPKHAPRLYTHGYKTKYVVVFAHGLYESPFYLKGISEAFFSQGFNVVTTLMPNTWEKDPTSIDRTTYKDWQASFASEIELAKGFGENIILAGYSTGGELAIAEVLKKPDAFKAMVLLAPAIFVSAKTAIGIFVGTNTGIVGNSFPWIGEADGRDIPYYSPYSGQQVIELQKNVLFENRLSDCPAKKPSDMFKLTKCRRSVYNKIKIPTFVGLARQDKVILNSEAAFFQLNLGGPSVLKFYEDVSHRAFTKRQDDILLNFPSDYNNAFDRLTQDILEFLSSNIEK